MFFKKGLEPRKFHHEPWFYDPEKEEFENRLADARERYHGEKTDTPVSRTFDFKHRVSIPSRSSRFETNYGKVNPTRLILLIVLLSAIVYFFFF